tara:strand:+ start:2474 stop:2896 length:423 start_codon:yes stop_codon:yes gene_type:complete
MQHAPAPLLDHIATWSGPAQRRLWACRALFHDIARNRDLGALDETLKWGQPSWRPRRPRTGSTLRVGWDASDPSNLAFFVDCKTDLAARMHDIYPNLSGNDGRRRIAVDLAAPFHEQAIAHLAEMTFSYHLSRRQTAPIG